MSPNEEQLEAMGIVGNTAEPQEPLPEGFMANEVRAGEIADEIRKIIKFELLQSGEKPSEAQLGKVDYFHDELRGRGLFTEQDKELGTKDLVEAAISRIRREAV